MLIDRHWDIILIHCGKAVTHQALAILGAWFYSSGHVPRDIVSQGPCEQKEGY